MLFLKRTQRAYRSSSKYQSTSQQLNFNSNKQHI